ncbi:hypothetical protein GCM10009557_60360 [Virgisporangium ochraceum]|uniref:Integral membrane protein n=1 Tax=Virgisporangium ochraceum TaxID=65505 RepID=A0A8J3ZT18_9ACTN|nr:hypothetical protein [Virgisporangium ochraceum]GIJ69389.1 hypothetical protein Voc01_043060 [Virgisporangium ochraceum]
MAFVRATKLGGGVQTGVLPLRPLTLGELLDAAVALLRGHAKVLLATGFVLAVVEQVVLYPLRVGTARPPYMFPYDDRLELYWLALSVGFATEIAIITALGGLTAQAAGPALLGERSRIRFRGGQFGAVAVLAGAAGAAGFLAAIACGVPWFALYALIGLVVPALVIDRVGPLRAIGRSMVLSCRGGLRGAFVRLAGYVAWGAVRVALGIGTLALIDLAVDSLDDDIAWLIAGTAWALVNTVAYPALACLDAVLHLETRMRTEGLDITLSRARATGRPPAASLVL